MNDQLSLALSKAQGHDEQRTGRGGAREGAGRKRKNDRTGPVAHRERAAHAARFPVHVTLRAIAGLASLRNERMLRTLHRHIARACERGRRIVEFSLQEDHLHLIVEASGREAIARTIQGFASIVARAFNRLLGRKGRFWEERYHRHDLRTPTEVHRALGYVLQNFRKHVLADAGALARRMSFLDPFSSAAWFDGWDDGGREAARALADWLATRGLTRCTAVARTFLLREGYKRISLVRGDHVPAAGRDRTSSRCALLGSPTATSG